MSHKTISLCLLAAVSAACHTAEQEGEVTRAEARTKALAGQAAYFQYLLDEGRAEQQGNGAQFTWHFL